MTEQVYEKLGQQVFRGELSNGLTIFVDRRPGFGKQFAFFATRYGGVDTRFETEEGWQDTPAGVAHFLEHKLFDTKDGNALQIMSANGCDPNAFTSFGITGYYFQCTQGFWENLRMLLRFVSEPWFTPESVAKEQGIIGQEIAMGDDEADTEVFYDMLNCLYAHHPIRTHIAGTQESISHITDSTLYTCHGAFYDPGNMVLTVVGDVDPEEVMAVAGEVITGVGKGSPRRDYGEEEPAEPVRHETERSMEVSTPLFVLGFKLAPPPDGPERLRAQLVGDLAGDILLGEASPLYQRLYEEGLITKDFSGGYEDYPQAAFYAVSGESRDPRAVRDAILAEAERTVREGIDPKVFARAKKAAYGSMVTGLNSFENTAVELTEGYFSGFDYLTFPQVFQSIAADHVVEFIRRCFDPRWGALAIITPEGEGA